MERTSGAREVGNLNFDRRLGSSGLMFGRVGDTRCFQPGDGEPALITDGNAKKKQAHVSYQRWEGTSFSHVSREYI